jgi:hypothetical protein
VTTPPNSALAAESLRDMLNAHIDDLQTFVRKLSESIPAEPRRPRRRKR